MVRLDDGTINGRARYAALITFTPPKQLAPALHSPPPVLQTCKTFFSAKKTSGQAYQTQAMVGFAADMGSDVPAARPSIGDEPPNPEGNMSGPTFS